jgi:hypothetical protein
MAFARQDQVGPGFERGKIRFITVMVVAAAVFIIVAGQRQLIFLFDKRGLFAGREVKRAFYDQSQGWIGRQDVSGQKTK